MENPGAGTLLWGIEGAPYLPILSLLVKVQSWKMKFCLSGLYYSISLAFTQETRPAVWHFCWIGKEKPVCRPVVLDQWLGATCRDTYRHYLHPFPAVAAEERQELRWSWVMYHWYQALQKGILTRESFLINQNSSLCLTVLQSTYSWRTGGMLKCFFTSLSFCHLSVAKRLCLPLFPQHIKQCLTHWRHPVTCDWRGRLC